MISDSLVQLYLSNVTIACPRFAGQSKNSQLTNQLYLPDFSAGMVLKLAKLSINSVS